jgi:hypothetical protein
MLYGTHGKLGSMTSASTSSHTAATEASEISGGAKRRDEERPDKSTMILCGARGWICIVSDKKTMSRVHKREQPALTGPQKAGITL